MSIVQVIEVLNELVEQGVVESYAIGGAVGATFYLEPVATLDIDVFVRMRAAEDKILVDPQPIFAFLGEHGHAMEGEYVMIGEWPVQFLGPPGALGEEALDEATTIEVEGIPTRVFPAEYIAALCLQTGRAKDKARLLQFVEEGAFDPEKFEGIITRHDLSSAWERFVKEFLSS